LDCIILAFQIDGVADNCASRAESGAEDGDLAIRLFPDLLADPLLMRFRVVRIGVLARIHPARLRSYLPGLVDTASLIAWVRHLGLNSEEAQHL
jgi:hypothetical protein